ncbi:hypothetical protein M408DRAFT_23014 [Serendipita vermifera MAFF 305830]|uniref:Uncharacterized protein n=1 Tax=Serendipita vermifera MAFF 305830 TaxID=933852 RepID=A0A0C2XJI2_SERVB|nr:hypothetical protein M408DRAFT_23014 [Serendipita vermifera MAFF 305830]
MEETVDYKLQRQKQQEARFKARGATWKPSGKPCTLQFVFEDMPEEPPTDSRKQTSASQTPSEAAEENVPATTRPPSPRGSSRRAVQSKAKSQRVVRESPPDFDAPDVQRGSSFEEDSRRPPNTRKPTKRVGLGQTEAVAKTTNREPGSRKKRSALVEQDTEKVVLPEPPPQINQRVSLPEPHQKRKETFKPSTNPSDDYPDEDIVTKKSSRPLKPKEMEKGKKAPMAKPKVVKSKEQPSLPRKRLKPMTEREKDEDSTGDEPGSDVETTDKKYTCILDHSNLLLTAVLSVTKAPQGRNAQSSKKRRILLGDGAQQWSIPASQQTSRKTTVHFGLPLSKAVKSG